MITTRHSFFILVKCSLSINYCIIILNIDNLGIFFISIEKLLAVVNRFLVFFEQALSFDDSRLKVL